MSAQSANALFLSVSFSIFAGLAFGVWQHDFLAGAFVALTLNCLIYALAHTRKE